MKTHTNNLVSAVAAFVLLGAGSSLAQESSAVSDEAAAALENMEPIELTFGHFVAPSSTLGETYTEYARMIEERTNGKVTIRYFWSNSLFGMKEALEAVSDGIADIGIVNSGYFPSDLPLMASFEHGYNASDLWVGQRATSRLQRESEILNKQFEDNDLKWIAPYTSGTFQFFFKDGSDWDSTDDFEGLTLRTTGGARADWHTALGAQPIFMPITDVYEAMERGVIGGFENTLSLAADLKQNEVTDIVLDLNSGVVMGASTVMNLDTWNELPEPVQEIILDTGVEWGEVVQAKAIIERERKIRNEWESEGVAFNTPSEDQIEKMREMGRDAAMDVASGIGDEADEQSEKATKILEALWQHVEEANETLNSDGYPWQQ